MRPPSVPCTSSVGIPFEDGSHPLLVDLKPNPGGRGQKWRSRIAAIFAPLVERCRVLLQRRRLRLALYACGALATLTLVVVGVRALVESRSAVSTQAEISAAAVPVPDVRREVHSGTVNPGDTATSLFGRYFPERELPELLGKAGRVFPLTSLCAGQPYKVCLLEGAVERFEYDIDRDAQLIITRDKGELSVARVPIAYTISTEVVNGTITSSLFEAVTSLGETDQLAMNLADIFAWDVDFIRDIRSGDSFRVLVEKRKRDGKPAGYGAILAAEFVNQGETFSAVRFRDGLRGPGYYDRNGNSLRKAFLKAPLPFSRISSGFTMKRFHPIAKTWRAHPAIDYAAPAGTPIKTVGDGTISAIGRTGGNGNYIKVRHPGGYETIYLHMRAFAKGMRHGKRVEQGQVIGYVGSTGLATGPHLCFRMTKNGAPVNPAKVKLVSAAPVSREHIAEFKALAEPLLARLAGREPVVASTPAAPPAGTPQ